MDDHTYANRPTQTGRGLAPSVALNPSAFYSLYLGSLALPDKNHRTQASVVTLLSGRLGLRPGEIQHLHEGWIDWNRGELRIPDRDPCACELCWQTARNAQRAGDGRRLNKIITETMWASPGGGRTIPFAWSNRLTAALATVCEEEYLDVTVESIAQLITASAELAQGLDPKAINFRTLRATGASFFADTGFPAHRVAGLLGEPSTVAREFTRREGGDAREQLFRLFGANSEEAAPEETYALLTDPEPFEQEPFNPSTYDADWRHDRAERVAQDDEPLRNPRPVTNQTETTLDPSNLGTRRHLDTDSDLVREDNAATTLRQWVHDQEETRRNDTGSATQTSPTQADATGPSVSSGTVITDPQEHLDGEPLFTAETEVACVDIADGQPVACRVFVGPESLLLIHDDNEMAPPDAKQIKLASVVGQSIDYVPSELADTFDSTVGIAYDEGEGQNIAVLALSGNKRVRLTNIVFKQVLSECPVFVTHPAKRGGRVTDNEPVAGQLTADNRSFSIKTSDDHTPDFRIRLRDIMDIGTERQTIDGDERWSLSIKHLTDDGAANSKITARDDRQYKLLRQFAKREYKKRKHQLKKLSLSDDEKEVLVALYSASNQMDISMIIDKDADEFQAIINSLNNSGLVRTGGSGAELTGLGRVAVNRKVEDVNV
jgi:helix-turn-helix protein